MAFTIMFHNIYLKLEILGGLFRYTEHGDGKEKDEGKRLKGKQGDNSRNEKIA